MLSHILIGLATPLLPQIQRSGSFIQLKTHNKFLKLKGLYNEHMVPICVQDFYNLVDVYLDAVFFPKCVEDVKTFQQEGWHYELNDPSEDITYKGRCLLLII